MTYVVIGTAPTVETSIAVGPFQKFDRAHDAAQELISRGYVAELCELTNVDDVVTVLDWDEQVGSKR